MTWNRAWSPKTITDVTVGFDRLGSLLLPAEGAVGFTLVGSTLTSLGPFPIIPIDRAQNRFRLGATMTATAGKHTLTSGFAVTRLQYNGIEPDGALGITLFANDFGRDAITNFRSGTASRLIISLGSTYRGFRNVDGKFFIGDRWQATNNLTVSTSLRYEPFSRPADVTGRSELPFDSDLNNWGGSFGLAYRLPNGWGVLRAAYGLVYGEIFPVTYGQDRLNTPHTATIVIPAPDLVDPLGGILPEDVDPNSRSNFVEVGPDLATPYSHQYNFSWELGLASDWRLQLGYVGSRSHKLIITYFLNRARPVEGIEFATRTINQRRPNPTRFNHLLSHNGSRGYYDAARVSLISPNWRGLTINASYWLSKAIDLGGTYTNTASGPDARNAVSQTEIESHRDLKALSNFDQPHAFLLQASYDTPGGNGLLRKILGDWTVSTVTLLKAGTPFTVRSGADSPGIGNADSQQYDRPVVLDPSSLGRTIGNPDTSVGMLPRSAFRFINAPQEQTGDLGRNTFRKGKIANVNASLSRSWALSQDWTLEFRAESINFFNTPQFAQPTFSLTSPSFGQINNTLNDGRTFRFQIRLIY